MSCETFVFFTKQTCRITACLCFSGFCNISWVFFRFGKIDGNINRTVLCFCYPFFILGNTILADVICCLTKFVIIIRCFHRRNGIFFSECALHYRRCRCQNSHNLCIKQIFEGNRVIFQNSGFIRNFHQVFQNFIDRSYFTGKI